jgi:hypothetical protein
VDFPHTFAESGVTAEPNTISPFTAPKEPATTPGESFSAGSVHGAAVQATPGWHVWLWRLRALLFVTVCATFGVLLLILPWTNRWTDNPLLLTSPVLRQIVSSGFVRGLSSGLGVLDLWLGFWEAIHYHESPR